MGVGMVGLAQLVRASDCGPEGRRFNSDIPPHIVQNCVIGRFFDDVNREVKINFVGSIVLGIIYDMAKSY